MSKRFILKLLRGKPIFGELGAPAWIRGLHVLEVTCAMRGIYATGALSHSLVSDLSCFLEKMPLVIRYPLRKRGTRSAFSEPDAGRHAV